LLNFQFYVRKALWVSVKPPFVFVAVDLTTKSLIFTQTVSGVLGAWDKMGKLSTCKEHQDIIIIS
jgi:hypothetical protein